MKSQKDRIKAANAGAEACIMTHSGRYFFFEAPEKSGSICIEDIAHALSNLCRYNGMSKKFYSVAQHSVHVAAYVKSEALRVGASLSQANALGRWGLMHDDSEAYLGDMTSPLKRLLPEYQRIESNVMRAICKHFDLPLRQPALVKRADLALLAAERRDIMPKSYVLDEDHWNITIAPPRGLTIIPWSSAHAKATFLHEYAELCT
jgi:hypothetical protein